MALRAPITGEQRARVKAYLDAEQRARRQARIQALDLEVCAGCGTDRENRTTGCGRCSDRHQKWRKRGDPAFLERERVRQQKTRHRRAELQRQRRAQKTGRTQEKTAHNHLSSSRLPDPSPNGNVE